MKFTMELQQVGDTSGWGQWCQNVWVIYHLMNFATDLINWMEHLHTTPADHQELNNVFEAVGLVVEHLGGGHFGLLT